MAADAARRQSADGAFPDVAPVTCCGEGTAGWGDAGTVVPWALYRRYGDPRVLTANYDAMTQWITYLKTNSSGLIRPNQGYGDWLAPDGSTPLDLIGTAFFAYRTDIVRQTAQALGKDEDAATYASLYSQIKSAFASRWVRGDGTVGSSSQTSYVLALKFGLVPDNLKQQAFNRLVDDVTGRGNHLAPASSARRSCSTSCRTAAAATSPTRSSRRTPIRAGATCWPRRDDDLGALGRHPPGRRAAGRRHELVQPLRARLDRRLAL